MGSRTPSPTDAAADKAWDQIASIARAHCLVVDAAAGVMVLATPAVQREQGVRDRVLRAHQCSEPAGDA